MENVGWLLSSICTYTVGLREMHFTQLPLSSLPFFFFPPQTSAVKTMDLTFRRKGQDDFSQSLIQKNKETDFYQPKPRKDNDLQRLDLCIITPLEQMG